MLGYVTVSPDGRFEVSRRLKTDFDNGRHYYDLQGTPVRPPRYKTAMPSAELWLSIESIGIWDERFLCLTFHSRSDRRMKEFPIDTRIRLAVVEHIKRVNAGGVVTGEELRAGFFVDRQRIPLINPQRGIFKPASMEHCLASGPSIREPVHASGTMTNGPFKRKSSIATSSSTTHLWAQMRTHQTIDGSERRGTARYPYLHEQDGRTFDSKAIAGAAHSYCPVNTPHRKRFFRRRSDR
jgi:hypothetical protein